MGEYSKGKATTNRALAVYKLGALVNVNKLQLDDDRPSHVFGFDKIKPMFMDEVNLYTSLISIKGLLYMCNSCFMLG